MVADEYDDRACTVLYVPNEMSVHIECTQDPVGSVELQHDRHSGSNPNGTDDDDTGRAQWANRYRSLLEVRNRHRFRARRHGTVDIPRCIWCHFENWQTTTDRDGIDDASQRRAASDCAFSSPAFDRALVLNHDASPEAGCYCRLRSDLRPTNRHLSRPTTDCGLVALHFSSHITKPRPLVLMLRIQQGENSDTAIRVTDALQTHDLGR